MDSADSAPETAPEKGLVFRLAAADLAHEWILSSCLVLAVAAVLAPLIILFGLKHGTVETLRERLLQDPRNREIRPMVSASFSKPWIEELGRRADVAFVVPATRQISANVDASIVRPESEASPSPKLSLNLIPTLTGDPLLLENGSPIPSGEACVLSLSAAEALEAEVGDTLAVLARRRVGTEVETGRLTLRVAGILDARASALKSLFATLPVVEAVERFKDGLAVPEYGWSGKTPAAYPVFDGLAVTLPSPLAPAEAFTLYNGSGFSGIERQWDGGGGTGPPGGSAVYRLKTGTAPVGEESIACIRSRLRGKSAALIPQVDDIPAVLTGGGGPPVPLVLRSAALPAPPREEAAAKDGPSAEFRKILLPAELKAALPSSSVFIRVERNGETLAFPAAVMPETAPGTRAMIPPGLAAVLNLFESRSIDYEAETDRFVLARRGYAGFRLYAATLEAVDGLRRHFEEGGIPVNTEAERIRDVQALDRHLTLIFWLIAAVGLAGGAAALSASLYAAIERKQKELAVLRLLGFSGGTLFRFPIVQGLCIGLGGTGIAIGFYGLFSALINALFGARILDGERLCRLPATHLASTLLAAGMVSALAAMAAACRAIDIDPAEALRDE